MKLVGSRTATENKITFTVPKISAENAQFIIAANLVHLDSIRYLTISRV